LNGGEFVTRRTLWAAALILCAAGWATSQTGGQPGQPPSGQIIQASARPIADAEFITLAGSGGLLEVQSSQWAQQKASSDEVKRFAQQMGDDHNKANQEMAALLGRKGMGVPRQLTTCHAAILQCLSEATGPKFDAEYVTGQVGAHVEAVALFEAYSKSGQDQELKAWATKTLPTLKHHKEMACKLLKSLPVTGNDPGR